jgi:hypothetical protein
MTLDILRGGDADDRARQELADAERNGAVATADRTPKEERPPLEKPNRSQAADLVRSWNLQSRDTVVISYNGLVRPQS